MYKDKQLDVMIELKVDEVRDAISNLQRLLYEHDKTQLTSGKFGDLHFTRINAALTQLSTELDYVTNVMIRKG